MRRKKIIFNAMLVAWYGLVILPFFLCDVTGNVVCGLLLTVPFMIWIFSRTIRKILMRFGKHEPPKPTLALRNLLPMRESYPIACATSSMLAPVASQIAESALMDEMRWASIAFAASLESSEDQRPTVRIRSVLLTRKIRERFEI